MKHIVPCDKPRDTSCLKNLLGWDDDMVIVLKAAPPAPTTTTAGDTKLVYNSNNLREAATASTYHNLVLDFNSIPTGDPVPTNVSFVVPITGYYSVKSIF